MFNFLCFRQIRVVSSGRVTDAHLQKIAYLCCFCGKPAKTKTKSGKINELFRDEFLAYGVKLEEYIDSVHPRLVCSHARLVFIV